PVAAAESPSTQSSDSAEAKAKKAEAEKAEKEKAEAEKKAEEKAAAEKEAAEKAAKEKAEAEKKAADKAAKEKAAEEKAAKDKAAEDKSSDEKKVEKPKKVDPKPAPPPKDDDEGDDSDEAEELNASLKLSTQSIKAEDLAEDGLRVTVTNLEKGVKVSVSGGDLTADTTTASGSSATLTLKTNEDAEDIAAEQSVSLQVQRTGVAPQSLTDSVSVQSSDDDDVDPIDASLTVDPEEITAEDLANEDKGVEVTVSGVEKGDRIKDSLTGKTETAEADGDHVLHVWWEGNPDSLEVGEVPFDVTIDREGTESETLKGTINVVDDTE